MTVEYVDFGRGVEYEKGEGRGVAYTAGEGFGKLKKKTRDMRAMRFYYIYLHSRFKNELSVFIIIILHRCNCQSVYIHTRR